MPTEIGSSELKGPAVPINKEEEEALTWHMGKTLTSINQIYSRFLVDEPLENLSEKNVTAHAGGWIGKLDGENC